MAEGIHIAAGDFLQAEAHLRQADNLSDAEFYAALRLASLRFGQVDALYVCLYDKANEMLHFLYNFEGGRFDHPESFPLGKGPTSWVIRNNRPLFIEDAMEPTGLTFRRFGIKERITNTQLHIPLLHRGNSAIGVYSVQAEPTAAYDEEQIAAFCWLAHRISGRLETRTATDLAIDKKTMEEACRKAAVNAVRRVSGQFMRKVGDLVQGFSSGRLKTDITSINAALESLQVDAFKYTINLEESPQNDPQMVVRDLTRRELEVLSFLSEGLTNKQIAERLSVSTETVKTHAKQALRKAGLKTRRDAIIRRLDIKSLKIPHMGE